MKTYNLQEYLACEETEKHGYFIENGQLYYSEGSSVSSFLSGFQCDDFAKADIEAFAELASSEISRAVAAWHKEKVTALKVEAPADSLPTDPEKVYGLLELLKEPRKALATRMDESDAADAKQTKPLPENEPTKDSTNPSTSASGYLAFVFDVESIGLHGEAFAVAGGIYDEHGDAMPGSEFKYSVSREDQWGYPSDREWLIAKQKGAFMAVECGWPVEARFLNECIDDHRSERMWEGPYPLHEIANEMRAAGMNPMANYDRLPGELPKHDPLADARQSARLLAEARRNRRCFRGEQHPSPSDGMATR